MNFKKYLTESESMEDLKKELYKLNRKVFKVMPRSPLQKQIQERIVEIKEKLKKLGYDADKALLDYIQSRIDKDK